MLKATSKARKQDLGLTVTRATRDARKVVDRVMPGVFATVESRTGYDLAGDFGTVITTVTFPANAERVSDLHNELAELSGRHGWVAVARTRIVITRKR